jgi:hypothetical protein
MKRAAAYHMSVPAISLNSRSFAIVDLCAWSAHDWRGIFFPTRARLQAGDTGAPSGVNG